MGRGGYERLAEEAIARCRVLAGCSEVEGETTRTFLCEAMREVHWLVGAWMTEAGMRVSVDAVGNIRGVAGERGGRRLVIGSHLDTVPNAGAFDGVLGVMLGIALAGEMREERLPFGIEVIGFSEEEGVRFRRPFLGSLAAIGGMDEGLLGAEDRDGISVREAIGRFGLNAKEIGDARLGPEVFGYFEIHIEQGPLLESVGRALGVVSALVGQTRMEFRFTGEANHAGTTPMHLRHDAMAAAAEWMGAVEAAARGCDGMVATVGRVEASPGVGNVIAADVVATLDLRHAMDAVRTEAVARLTEAAVATGARRGVRVRHRVLMEQAAVRLDEGLTERLAAAAALAGYPPERMTSGAGHDAMMVAPHLPAAMLFLRSPGGISHHPRETVLLDDVVAALEVGAEFLRGLAGR